TLSHGAASHGPPQNLSTQRMCVPQSASISQGRPSRNSPPKQAPITKVAPSGAASDQVRAEIRRVSVNIDCSAGFGAVVELFASHLLGGAAFPGGATYQYSGIARQRRTSAEAVGISGGDGWLYICLL